MSNGENDYLIRSDGRRYPLQYYGAAVTGLGATPIEHQARRGYKQRGVTIDGFFLGPRTLSFAFDLYGLKRQDVWDRRQELLDQLNPETGIVTYRKIMPDGSRRDIDGWLDASTSLAETDDPRVTNVGFSLFCPDPTFYDPTAESDILAASEVDAFVLPFAVPDGLWFGGSTQLTGTLTNPGSWRAYPTIRIGGPFSRLVLTNSTTGASITLGVALAYGHEIVITLTPGNQSVLRDGVNAFDEIEEGNLVDWYIAPGDNVIVCGGAGLTTDSFVQIAYHPRYLAL